MDTQRAPPRPAKTERMPTTADFEATFCVRFDQRAAAAFFATALRCLGEHPEQYNRY
jgi:hypothetical protein